MLKKVTLLKKDDPKAELSKAATITFLVDAVNDDMETLRSSLKELVRESVEVHIQPAKLFTNIEVPGLFKSSFVEMMES